MRAEKEFWGLHIAFTIGNKDIGDSVREVGLYKST